MMGSTNAGNTTLTNVAKESSITLNPGVQIVSATILTQSGNWFIETYVSDSNILQRATSMTDPSNVAIRTSANGGTSWNGWTYQYAVWHS